MRKIICAVATLIFFNPLAVIATPVPLYVHQTELGSGQIFLDCSFDGHPSKCLLDTGGRYQFIKYDEFSAQYPVIRRIRFSSATGKVRECDVVKIGSFEFADIELRNREFIRCDEDGHPFSTIGIGLFGRQTLNINLIDNTLEVAGPVPTGLEQLPLRKFPTGQFSIKVEAAGSEIETLFDTGAGLSVIDDAFVQSHPGHFSFIKDIPGGRDGTGQDIWFKLFEVDRIRFAGINISKSYLVSMDLTYLKRVFIGISGILGFNHLSDKNWYIDLENNRWAVWTK